MDPTFGEIFDTSPEERAKYYALIARLTPEERVRKMTALGQVARELARADLARTYPHASPTEIEIELVARLYGRAVARRLTPYLVGNRG